MLNFNLLYKLKFYCLIFISASLFLPFIFSNILIILLIILVIIENSKSKFIVYKRLDYSQTRLLIIFISFYIIHIIGLIHTENIKNALFFLEKSLSLLLFPLLLISNYQISSNKLKIIFYTFVLSCFIATIAMLWSAYNFNYVDITNTSSINWEIFTSQILASFIYFHPTYLSIYITFSIFIISLDLFDNWNIYSSKIKILLGLLSFYFICVLILLAARIVILAFLLIFILLGFIISYRLGYILRLFIGISIICFTLIIAVYNIPPLTERFKEVINYKNQYSIDKRWGGRAMRLLKWECCLILIKKNPIIGVGTGDTQDELQECYKENKFDPLLHWPDIKFNAHNQFLQTYITIGVAGFIILLAYFVLPGFLAFKQEIYLYISFLALFAVCSLTESLLEANKGIVFYAFFNALFAFHKLSNNK